MAAMVFDGNWVSVLTAGGIAALALAALGWRAERRRRTRSDPDAIGWLPWLAISFWASFAALLLLGAAVKLWVAR